MKSVIYSVALVGCLSAGNLLFAQGRGGRAGGTIEIPIREPRATRSAPADTERGNRPDSATERGARGGTETREPKDVVQQLTDNPALTTRLKDFFPMDTDLGLMAADFRNLGQFVAAVHVSHNLEIPFLDLKTKMVTEKKSLGEAIKSWKEEMTTTEVNAEVQKAEEQAKEDLSTTS